MGAELYRNRYFYRAMCRRVTTSHAQYILGLHKERIKYLRGIKMYNKYKEALQKSAEKCNKHWKHQEQVLGFSDYKELNAWTKHHVPSNKDKQQATTCGGYDYHNVNL